MGRYVCAVLVWSRGNFLQVASVQLCFAFVLITVLITQGCFCYCWAGLTQSQGFSASHPTSVSKRLGMYKKLGGGTIKTAHPTDHREIPCPITSWSTLRRWERKNYVQLFRVMVFASQAITKHNGALLSWRGLNICLPIQSGEWIPYFALLKLATLSIKLFLSLCIRSLFYFSDCLPYFPGEKGVSSCMVLGCCLGLKHDSSFDT